MPEPGNPVEFGNPRLIAQRRDKREVIAALVLVPVLEYHSLYTRQAHA
ncbi:MAG: hypothetical protein ACLGQX_08770 [Acidobacteriota bacterium]|jgi:hypothetical protein